MTIEFQAWPKTPRLFRQVTITEKIDGTNAAVIIRPAEGWTENRTVRTQDGQVYEAAAQSRKRLVTPEQDNYGFARWVWDNAQYLAEVLGEGYHYGEWWGQGIQRRYGMDRKVFSLFNTRRYSSDRGATFELDSLRVVPVLYQGVFTSHVVEDSLANLAYNGSSAAPGFDQPEGVCLFHEDAGQVFKVLLENDDIPKSAVAA